MRGRSLAPTLAAELRGARDFSLAVRFPPTGLLGSGAPLAHLDGGGQVIFYGWDDIVAEIRKLIECA